MKKAKARAKTSGKPGPKRKASPAEDVCLEPRDRSQTILNLSTETLVDILHYLTYIQLVACHRACKRFRLIIDETKSLKCAIELGAASYDESPTSTLSVSDLLGAFHKSQRVYRNPDPKIVRKTLDASGPFSQPWSAYMWEVLGDMFISPMEDKHKIGVLSLRSDVADEDRARIMTFPHEIESFGVDRSQDLLATYVEEEHSLYFFSLKDGLVHSKATGLANGGFPCVKNFEVRFGPDLTFCGDWLLAQFRCKYGDGNVICLYHWPTGTLKRQWISEGYLSLDKDHILYFPGCFARGHLFIPFQNQSLFQIHVHRLPSADPVKDPVVQIASYGFPDRDTSSRYVPNIRPVDSTFSHDFRPAFSMLQLTFGSAPPIFISMDAFKSAFDIKELKSRHKAISIPWEHWGPKHTRVVEKYGELRAFGRRVVYQDSILDFNPYDLANDVYGPTLSRGRALRNTGDDYSGVVRVAQSTLPDDVGFPEPLNTALPYRKTHLNVPIVKQNNCFSVFEEDGIPKFVRIVFAASGTPKYLHFITL
ncbi:hypothetical protein EIP86_005095 [Pleurotus ostreatoroseus]|nr:hypothetical protein EIP86_005095 [Pleurotus ostreatoroseus]